MSVYIFAVLALMPGLVYCAEISGHIELYAEGKLLRTEESQDAIVYFRPKQPAKITSPATPYLMTTRRKQFVPRVLAVPVGSEIRFPNEDPILHNAFSSSKDNSFDVGLYGEGEGQIVTFNHAGYIKVYCNVHHSMVGHILVLDTPYFTKPDAQGEFSLHSLPEVPGDLVVWHDRATPWHNEADLSVPAKPFVIKLEITQRRVPPHMNKFGKPYDRGNDGGY